MLKNYIKIAFRNLWRQKGYAFINILGLALGCACCLLISLYVWDELSYDRHHEKADRIFRVTAHIYDTDRHWAATGPPLAHAMLASIPEIEAVVRFYPVSSSIRYKDQLFKEPDGVYADSTVFDIFTFPLVHGNPETALAEPNSIILTTSMAHKYFGSADPLGQTLELDGGQGWRTLTVTGVLQDLPRTTHLPFDYMVSMQTYSEGIDWLDDARTWAGFYNYILIRHPENLGQLKEKLPAFIDSFYDGLSDDPASEGRRLILQPLRDIHLYSQLEKEYRPNGDITYVYVFSIIALFLLIMACVNFINLTTARVVERIREVGVRKALGAHRSQLATQFLSESAMLCLFSLLLAIMLTDMLLPLFNHLTGGTLESVDLMHSSVLILMASLVLVTGLVSGSYPAFILSGFRPIQALQGLEKRRGQGGTLRKGLVVFQFTISIFLLIGTGVVFNQLHYFYDKQLGFDKEHVVKIELTGFQQYVISQNHELFHQELLRNPSIILVSQATDVPGERHALADITVDGMLGEPLQTRQIDGVDHSYIETLGIEIVAGRNFLREAPADSNAWIINEAALGHLDLENPIGRILRWNDYAGPIVGVMQNFHFASLHYEIEPLIIPLRPGMGSTLLLRTTGKVDEALTHARAVFDQLTPGDLFQYTFLDEDFDRLYQSETRLSELFSYFSGIAIFIACLGLFGLAAYTAEQRTKEIGIRKVLGASMAGIVTLLSKDFLKFVLIGFLIAVPIAWYVMNRWLQDFAYRIEIGPDVFLLAGSAAVLIALATVSYQSVKAALMNPVESLKNE